jgi:anti-sigma factor RsiW
MTEHVTAWLGAYHDGELQEHRVHQIEAHLAECARCRAQLEQLQALTALLGASPPAVDLTPSERFVAQVGLRLRQRSERSTRGKALEIGWRLAPLGLLGAWAFLQAAFLVAGVTLLARHLGLGGELLASLGSASPPGPTLAETLRLSGAGLNDLAQVVLYWLRDKGPIGWGVTLNLAAMAVISLLYGSWLASWWARRRRRQL